MEIYYSIYEYKPEVQYIASLDVGMASVNPEISDVKVQKQRLDRQGITITVDKHIEIHVLKFIYYILLGTSLTEIIRKYDNDKYCYPYNINIIK